MAENHTQSSDQCSQSRPVFLLSHSLLVLKATLVLPCAVLVLHLGYRRQRRHSAAASHTDVLTYAAAALDLVLGLGLLLLLCGELSGLPALKTLGSYVCAFTFPAPVLLHVLTCLERYLAVVHPVTYLRLRRSAGTWVRNGLLVCTGLLCAGWSAGGPAAIRLPYVPTFFLFALALVAVTLSSLWVLVALLRPKPGEGGGASPSRRRAFQTMALITGALWMWILGILVTEVVGRQAPDPVSCLVLVSGYWFSLPSHLVLPLLFLHRAGRLSACSA